MESFVYVSHISLKKITGAAKKNSDIPQAPELPVVLPSLGDTIAKNFVPDPFPVGGFVTIMQEGAQAGIKYEATKNIDVSGKVTTNYHGIVEYKVGIDFNMSF